MWACAHSNLEIMKILLKNKADISTKNNNGNTALDISINNKKYDIVKYLVNYILDHKPDLTYLTIPYATDEQIEKYPLIFAGIDHDLIGLNHNT